MATGRFSYRDEDWDTFEDAKDTLDMEFEPLIKDAELAVGLFLNNDFDKSKEVLVRGAKTSMYHALGLGVIEFTEALLTFEHDQMVKAAEALENCEAICLDRQHKMSMAARLKGMVATINYNDYGAEAVHSILVQAETTLLRSILLLFEDENLISFLRAIMKVKMCYGSLKECREIAKVYRWKSDYLRDQFETGIKAGLGCFNLLLSLLPKKIIKLVELVGFSADRKVGLRLLEDGSKNKSTRAQLCYLALMSYHLMIIPVLTHTEGDLKYMDNVLDILLGSYPNGSVFLMFKARLEYMKGKFLGSEEWYMKSWKSQDLWPQFHHISFWELMWLNLIKQDFPTALKYIDMLIENNKWSLTIYLYIKASFLIAMDGNKDEIEKVMKKVPLYKKKMAGKSVPTEKFLINRSKQYLESKYLFLPFLEVLYIYNLFKIAAKDVQIMQNILKTIDKELERIPKNNEYAIDCKCQALLLKGCTLRYLDSPLQAEECFKEIIQSEKKLKKDGQTVAWAYYELCMAEMKNKNYEKALRYIELARKKNTGYTLENKLNYKVEPIQQEIAEITGKEI